MNTANLQHRGLLLVLAELIELLKRKNVVTDEEMSSVLHRAEKMSRAEQERGGSLSEANREAISFPMRFLRRAAESGGDHAYGDVAAGVGRAKDRARDE